MSRSASIRCHFGQWMPPGRRLYGSRITLARLDARHAPALATLMAANRRWLETWMPALPETFTADDVRHGISLEQREIRKGTRLDLGIFLEAAPRRLIGRIALHTVQWGIIRSAGIGYWIDETHAGRGLMKEAVATLVSFTFEEVQLHRIWAGIQPANLRSRSLVEELGFALEGLHRRELFIAGDWQDQLQYALLEEEYDRLADGWIRNRWLGR
ncbi:MAG TPA: GNAT family protein [Candidatus Ozemobacteraceae bacterium]|nr:GNAT family protein [Candidatus Ozemobacteraceae bacterium]